MTNPILAFSARRRMRSIRTPVLLTTYSFLVAVVSYFMVYAAYLQSTITLSEIRMGVYGYILMLVLQFGLLVLIAPAMTAGSISGERERQTLDLLLVTNTGTMKLVIGKLLESFGFLALLALCSMPTLSLVLLTGGATILQVLTSVLYLLLISLAALSVGLFCSSLFKRTVTATVVSYLSVFGIGLITLLPIFYDVPRIGALYDSVNILGKTLPEYLDYMPVSFVINPGLGLLTLIDSQTGMFAQYIWRLSSHTLSMTWEMLHINWFLYANMGFLALLSVLLTGLSALNVRRKIGGKPKRSAKQ